MSNFEEKTQMPVIKQQIDIPIYVDFMDSWACDHTLGFKDLIMYGIRRNLEVCKLCGLVRKPLS